MWKSMDSSKKALIIAIAVTVIVGGLSAIFFLSIGKKTDKGEENAAQTAAAAETGTGEVTEMAADVAETSDTSAASEASGASDTKTQEGTASGSADSSGFYAEIKEEESWGDAPVNSKYTIKIVNKSGMDVDGWKLTVNVGNATLGDGWNGNYSIQGGVLTVTNADYNGQIPNGGNIEIGMILAGVDGDMNYELTAGSLKSTGTTAQSQDTQQNNASSSQSQDNSSAANVPNAGALNVPAADTDDWLHTDGNGIYDSNGKQVWLTGCNWFGYNTGTNTFDGLWNSDLNTSLQAIADHGFNLLRVPISAELILQWKSGNAPDANFNQATNSYLVGMDSLEIFDYVVGQCRANGLKIMLDIHCAETDASGHVVNLWYTDKITEAQYREALAWIAERYANDDTIIAFDLKNEPHGKPFEGDNAAIWNDSKDANNWKYEAEQAAAAVLAKNPNVLIMVEGTEIYPIDIKTNGSFASTNEKDYYFNWWGGNLRGVADYPVNLGKYNNKLVYSPHDYGPTVYKQPWFEGNYTYDSLMKDCWHDNWFYIYENKTAPLLIGEWGGYMTEPNITWMTHMRTLIGTYHLNHTFWCYNANSGDTGGLVKDDFVTWDAEKYDFVKEVLWQENGKFVGLDHKIPLGTAGNGISLSDAKGL